MMNEALSNTLFHDASLSLYRWLNNQPNVKEESLTDWLLFDISSRCKQVKYYTFTRHEESVNGADWDWWLLLRRHAYRFRVQAKKLRPTSDNWASLSYGNRNDIQMEMLLESALHDAALPLYMFYSSSVPDTIMQKKSFDCELIQKMIDWCSSCKCGGFLSPAVSVYKSVFGCAKSFLSAEKLLNASIKLSSLDYFLIQSHRYNGIVNQIDDILESINTYYKKGFFTKGKGDHRVLDKGFEFEYGKNQSQHSIPTWLEYLTDEDKDSNKPYEQGIPEWFEGEFRYQLPDVSGIIVFDLRNLH